MFFLEIISWKGASLFNGGGGGCLSTGGGSKKIVGLKGCPPSPPLWETLTSVQQAHSGNFSEVLIDIS